MKAISLWQPWASLMAFDAKRIETRHWQTSHRGPLAIHAAKRWTVDQLDLCCEEPFASVLRAHGVEPLMLPITNPLPFGAIVAVVDLRDVVPVESATDLSAQERAFGNYAAGRFAWRTANVVRLAEPVACRGMQSIWEPAPEVDAALLQRLSPDGGLPAWLTDEDRATLLHYRLITLPQRLDRAAEARCSCDATRDGDLIDHRSNCDLVRLRCLALLASGYSMQETDFPFDPTGGPWPDLPRLLQKTGQDATWLAAMRRGRSRDDRLLQGRLT